MIIPDCHEMMIIIMIISIARALGMASFALLINPVSLPHPPSLLPELEFPHSSSAVQRGFISTQEAKNLRALADFGMKNGGGAGGATIMDLPSGALSYGEQFIDVHQVMTTLQMSSI